MKNQQKTIEKTIQHALCGKDAHVKATSAVQGLEWKAAGVRPPTAPHSVFELLFHLNFWQEWVVKWLDGEKPSIPKHAAGSWPPRPDPASAEAWEQTLKRFENGLKELERRAREPGLFSKPGKKSRLEMLHTIASHNSYHLGQIVLLRRMLGNWPPPNGGLTW